MKVPRIGAIDCDIHPALPGLKSLIPFLSDHWRDIINQTGMHELESVSYPLGSPMTARDDWRPREGKAGVSLEQMRGHVLDPMGTSIAICNCLYGVNLLFSEDMAAGIARALNDWMAKEWLDHDPRLRASIVVPMQNPELAVDEIERCATDKRFVQVLMLAMADMPLGRRYYWPIYAAAERHGLPVGIHAGSSYRHPVTAVGWPSFYSEDYVNQAQAFQTQLSSLVCEGVFTKFPKIRMVLIEFGLHLAAIASLAADEILARLEDGSSLGRSATARSRTRSSAVYLAASGCAARLGDFFAARRSYGQRFPPSLLHRLSALAVRRRGRPTGWNIRRSSAQDSRRQSSGDLSPSDGGLAMNVNVAPSKEVRAATPAKQAIADCDLHPTPNTLKELYPYLETRWHRHLEMFGTLRRHGYQQGPAYPKGQPDAARRDAWPEDGRPGSRLDFMQRQHLDPNNVQLGVLTTIAPHPGGYQNAEMSAVFCRAINDWQVDQWTSKDKRLKASIMLPYEHGVGAVEEIGRRAGDPSFVQVFFLKSYRRATRSAAILADLRGGSGGQPAGRHPRLRLRRLSHNGRRLALLLHRGNGRPLAVLPIASHQHGARGRVRALPEAARCHH